MNNHLERLRRAFRRYRVLDMSGLRRVVKGRSKRSLFRDLAALGYQSSFTHTGRYYTIGEVCTFDEQGLWYSREIGFSQAGTLKETVALQVKETPQGRTHGELSDLLRVRVHNTLLELVRGERIGRESYRGRWLYVSADAVRAAEQLRYREQTDRDIAEMLRVATDEEVVEVLVEALKEAPQIPAPELVARRLVARGIQLEPHHVEQVYEVHGLLPGKKTARHNSRRSRH